jgi:mannose-6-phosphate isomerase-like protein (cupin superfamily)
VKRSDFDPGTVRPDGRRPAKATLFTAGTRPPWRGVVQGDAVQGGLTVLAYGNETLGEGPRLHVHPYDETFVVIEGHARFFIGDEVIDATAGDIVLGPKGIPHRFENAGPGRLQTIDIHDSPRWIQTDLD